jgi:long-chain acyl-CoA synthetase
VGVTIDNRIESVEIYRGAMRAGMRVIPLPAFLPKPARWATKAAARVKIEIGLGTGKLDPSSSQYENIIASYSTQSSDWTARGGGIALGTSGTEGRPRLLFHEWERMNWFLRACSGTFDFTEDTVLQASAPMTVGAGMIMVTAGLHAGSTVVLDREPPTAERAAEVAQAHNTTYMTVRPFLLRRLIEAGYTDRYLPSVETMASTTSELTLETQQEYLLRFGRIELLNCYAATDIGLVSFKRITEPTASLGAPFANVEVRIAGPDETGIGQIEVRGPSTALSAVEFIRDRPFGEWVTAGDYGQIIDGELHVVGRRSDKIIVNGYNVYAGEVEAVARRVPGVVTAAAVGVPDRKRGQNVALFYEGDASPDEIRAACVASLAPHAVPTMIELVVQLPTTPSGKVKKRELA